MHCIGCLFVCIWLEVLCAQSTHFTGAHSDGTEHFTAKLPRAQWIGPLRISIGE